MKGENWVQSIGEKKERELVRREREKKGKERERERERERNGTKPSC